jgi:hypothetical protein
MGGKVAISDIVLSQRSGSPIVVVAAPVTEGSIVKGVIFAAVDLKEFSHREIGTIKVLQTGYAFMFDRNGLLLAHPKTEHIMKTKISDFELGAARFSLCATARLNTSSKAAPRPSSSAPARPSAGASPSTFP